MHNPCFVFFILSTFYQILFRFEFLWNLRIHHDLVHSLSEDDSLNLMIPNEVVVVLKFNGKLWTKMIRWRWTRGVWCNCLRILSQTSNSYNMILFGHGTKYKEEDEVLVLETSEDCNKELVTTGWKLAREWKKSN